MSVTSVSLIGTVSAKLQFGGRRSYEVLYLVETDSANTEVVDIVTANGLPGRADYYQVGSSYDAGAFVTGYAPTLKSREDSRELWEVIVSFLYTPSSDKQNKTDPTLDELTEDEPWEKPARISGGGSEWEEHTRQSYSNARDTSIDEPDWVLVNSAQDFILHPIPVIRSEPDLVIEKDFREWNTKFTSYVNALNSETFFDEPAGHWRMKAPHWTKLYTGDGIPYFNLMFGFDYKLGGWNSVEIVDEGFMALDPVTHQKTNVTDWRGLPIFTSALLDGTGYQLTAFEDPVLYPPDGADPYRERDFADLNIPITRDGE